LKKTNLFYFNSLNNFNKIPFEITFNRKIAFIWPQKIGKNAIFGTMNGCWTLFGWTEKYLLAHCWQPLPSSRKKNKDRDYENSD